MTMTVSTRWIDEDLLVDASTDLAGGEATAVFNAERTHRYLLTRGWGPGKRLVWVMLNPSTADAERLDPTVTRCVTRARRGGYGGCWVLNLYALRSGDPAALRGHPDPVGPHNDRFIFEYVRDLPRGSRVVCAWGTNGPIPGRADQVRRLLWTTLGAETWCLAVNGNGEPRHPLHVAYAQPLIGYPF